MTYDKEEILNMLVHTPIANYNSFTKDDNNDFLACLDTFVRSMFDYEYGSTKFVLIPLRYSDYVIKIPYTGLMGENYEEEWDYDNYESNYIYEDFTGSDCLERPWDYCASEVMRYKIAEEEGFAECFAKTEFIGYIRDYPIYVQERCITLSEYRGRRYSQEERDRTSQCCGDKHLFINADWLTDFRFYYGEDTLIKFIDFIKDNGWDDDLREENIGYIGDKPVLIDYSGFFD